MKASKAIKLLNSFEKKAVKKHNIEAIKYKVYIHYQKYKI